MYCHCTNTSKKFNNYTNLPLKTEKQEMSYLNYNNALWDSFKFHIAQIGNMLPNQATLPDWAIHYFSWQGINCLLILYDMFLNNTQFIFTNFTTLI